MQAIELEHVTKKYNPGKHNEVAALQDVSFVLEQGTTAAVVGVSGCGKSTLLNMIGCLDVPTQGTVKLFGKPLDPKDDSARAKLRGDTIGFALQQLGLLPNDKVYDNIRLPLFYSDKFPRKVWKSRIIEIARSLKIDHLLKEKVRNLSGGQKQRVAIARALINDPAIILADEPTSALDKAHADEVMEILRSLKADGKTIVVVTHDVRIVHDFDYLIELDDGKIKNMTCNLPDHSA